LNREAEVVGDGPSCKAEPVEKTTKMRKLAWEDPDSVTNGPQKGEGPDGAFRKECEKAENSLGRAWQLPANAKDKKRNQARRARGQATQRRLAEEVIKAQTRQDRLRKREERRKRRSALPKRTKSSEGPVLIQCEEGGNQEGFRRNQMWGSMLSGTVKGRSVGFGSKHAGWDSALLESASKSKKRVGSRDL
jgi:hypothetical protein